MTGCVQDSNSKVSILIQARTSSARFPGKVLYQVNGRPTISYLIERLQQCKTVDKIILATSDHPSDDRLYDYCSSLGVVCYRGPLQNVAERFSHAIRTFCLDSFVRISGDSPLLDPQLVDCAVTLFNKERNCDFVTNIAKRTFPRGQSVEVFHSEVFLRGFRQMTEEEDFEHVTRFFYKRPHNYKFLNFENNDGDYSAINLSVDTAADMKMFERLVARMYYPHTEYAWKSLVAWREEMASSLSSVTTHE